MDAKVAPAPQTQAQQAHYAPPSGAVAPDAVPMQAPPGHQVIMVPVQQAPISDDLGMVFFIIGFCFP